MAAVGLRLLWARRTVKDLQIPPWVGIAVLALITELGNSLNPKGFPFQPCEEEIPIHTAV